MTYEKMQRIKRILICTLVLLVLFFVDQITKIIAQVYLAGAADIPIIPGWIALTYLENDAIAFGIGSGNTAFMTTIMIVTPILAAAFIALALTVFKRSFSSQIALFVISSGAVGNFVDRLFVTNSAGVAVVRDFVFLKFFNVCNFADFCITLGAVAFVFIILFIGPQALFPITKKWREQAKAEEAKQKKHGNA